MYTGRNTLKANTYIYVDRKQ